MSTDPIETDQTRAGEALATQRGETDQTRAKAADVVQRIDEMLTTPPDPALSIIGVIERALADPSCAIEKLEQLLSMQERIMERQAKAEHSAAKTLALAEMPKIPKRGRGHNDAKYATLEDIINTTRPVLARNGLSLDFGVMVDGDHIVVTAKITHLNGHEESTSLPLPFDKSGSKNAVQAIGSSQTYGQRYTAQAILGLSLGDDTEDDGAGGGTGPTVSPEQFTKLQTLLGDLGVGDGTFLKHYGVPSLEQFPAAKFEDAEDLLKNKLRRKGGK